MSDLKAAVAKALTHANQSDRHTIDHARIAEALTDQTLAQHQLRVHFASLTDEEWIIFLQRLSVDEDALL
jgi:molybdopterin-guanine dinucleotide biosynthesis protein